MRIVIDARESGTSTGRYVDKLIENLHQLKPNHHFVILTKSKRVGYLEKIAPSFKVIESNVKEFTFAEQIKLLKQVKALKPDLVHFSMVQQPVLYRGRVVTTMHDLSTVRFRNPAKNWFIFTFKQQVYKWVNKWVARKSNAIITPSEFVKDDVAKFAHTNSRKITVTYEAADKIADEAELVEQIGEAPFIMYVGRPLPHKNLWRLVEAFRELKVTHPDLKLVLVGKKDILYRLLELRVTKNSIQDVVFTGFISEGQLRWLYEHAASYVFPSLSEGFGLPPLEAMMHDCPVASSNATCLPEINGEAAAYFDPLNVPEMAATVAKIIDDISYANKLRTLGHKRAGEFSWERMAKQTLDVYNTVLSE